MTLKELIRKGSGRAGSNGAWQAVTEGSTTQLWHYGTLMLSWRKTFDEMPPVMVNYSIGHGSVSDQNGMNTAFRVLGFPYYYSRNGGNPRIERTER